MGTTNNRYGTYKQSGTPRQKRTIRIPGSLEDSNKYYRCWNCGVICNIERETLDTGEHSTAGINVKDAPEISPSPVLSDDRLAMTIYLDDPFTILENGPDGNPITDYRHNQYPQSIGGCWFCGTKNWK